MWVSSVWLVIKIKQDKKEHNLHNSLVWGIDLTSLIYLVIRDQKYELKNLNCVHNSTHQFSTLFPYLPSKWCLMHENDKCCFHSIHQILASFMGLDCFVCYVHSLSCFIFYLLILTVLCFLWFCWYPSIEPKGNTKPSTSG